MSNATEAPAFLFIGDDLIKMACHYYQLGRIDAALRTRVDREEDPDPMTNHDAMRKFQQEVADKLMNLSTREDDTTVFDEEPFVITEKS
jgi:hypothetical protein